jgi:Tfp pilus assembly protein PilW
MRTAAAHLRGDRHGESGLTFVELLVGVALMTLLLILVSANFFMNQKVYDVQSEIAAMQGEARRVVDYVHRDTLMAGYGCRFDDSRVDAIHPGDPDDPYAGYTDDRVAFRYNDVDVSTPLRDNMPQPSSEVKVEGTAGFQEGDRCVIFDDTGASDWFIITEVQTDARHLQHAPPINPEDFSKAYKVADNSIIVRMSEIRYFHVPDTGVVYRQRGVGTPRPIAHHIEDLVFTYYDDSVPPLEFTPDTAEERARIRRMRVSVIARTEHEHRDIRDHRFYRVDTEIVPRNVTLEGANP